MNRKEVRDLARKRLGETTAAFWTDTELNTWIDDGCEDLAYRTKCLKSNGYITTEASTQEYGLTTNLSGFFSVLDVYYYQDGSNWIKIEGTDREHLGESNAAWMSADAGTPQNYYWDREEDIIGFYPKPDSSNAGEHYCRIYYAKNHTAIGGDFSTIDIPDILHNAIVDYVVATGLDTRGWGDRSNDAWNKYFARIRDYQVERGREREDEEIISKNYRNI